MFDELVRARFDAAAGPLARACMAKRVTPLAITWTGLAIAIGASVAIAFGYPLSGLALWLASRIADGLDGVVARQGHTASAFGGFMDITLDMAAYSAMIVGFAVAHPEYAVLWATTLAGYILAVTTTLALAAAAEKQGRLVAPGNRTFQFTRGLAEAGETTVVYAVWCFWPQAIVPVGWAWCALLLASAVERGWLARRALL